MRAAAEVEAAEEERAVGRQSATATARQLTATALLLTPHRATQIELSAGAAGRVFLGGGVLTA